MNLPTPAQVATAISYDPGTGAFTRLNTGCSTGSPNARGFVTISVNNKQYLASRLAWVLVKGEWPSRNIIFADGDRSNLRWGNLRLAGNEDDLTAERVREVFDYDPATGKLTYRRNRGGIRGKGEEAGWICKRKPWMGGGYRVTGFNGREYGVHRLVWLWWHGRHARGCIDHINLDRADNRIENLRKCSHSENMANRRIQSNNTSGFKGVAHHKASGRWQANIGRTYLGLFDTPEEAHKAYVAAAKERFGEFARNA